MMFIASGDIAIISKKVKEKAIEKEKEKEVKSPKQKRLPPADFKVRGPSPRNWDHKIYLRSLIWPQ